MTSAKFSLCTWDAQIQTTQNVPSPQFRLRSAPAASPENQPECKECWICASAAEPQGEAQGPEYVRMQ